MNAHSPLMAGAAVARHGLYDTWPEDFLARAKGSRKRAHMYRRWAREDEAAGHLLAYRKHAAEARRQWDDAWWCIGQARFWDAVRSRHV